MSVGSLVWLITRHSSTTRYWVIALVLALRVSAGYPFSQFNDDHWIQVKFQENSNKFTQNSMFGTIVRYHG